ncbi:MAG: zinc-binding alcohol dehydrogenase family protein [Luteolibacter sp.]
MKAIGARCSLPTSHSEFLVEFDTPTPVVGPHDVLVRIQAVSVNPVDTKIRAGLGPLPLHDPRILGRDASGIIESVGSAVSGFSAGDEVMYAGDLTRPGCNAEYQAVDFRLIAHKPKSWSWADAAALPLVTLTAWELLFERMRIDPNGADSGKPILVINGAGGVGSALIPLAKSAGLVVVASASREKTAEWCRSLGADYLIDHHQALREQLEPLGISDFPYIANLHRPDVYWEQTSDLLAPFGTLGLIVEPADRLNLGDPLKAKCASIVWEFMAARSKFQAPDMGLQGSHLARIAERCDAGAFPKLVTGVLDGLSVENLRLLHAAMEQGTAYGKRVIRCGSAD